tara:strand:- start:1132 stop:1659 length:528 start_codon:yes stop_codon:yes gene_type:complete
MSDLTISVDFTGITPATGGIAILEPGLHQAVIEDFTHYTDNGNALYVYMNTDGQRHRERFNLDNENARSFLKSFLMSAGCPEDKLGGSSNIPFHKFIGKPVYFNYTPPRIDERGNRVDGTYARYVFYPKARYDKMAKYANVSSSDIVVEAEAPKANGAGKASVDSGDDFDFLLDR